MSESSIVPAGAGKVVTARGSVMAFKAAAAHTFGNDTGQAARLLVLHAPAMDAYFTELEELWSRETPPAPEEERALMSRFGMEPG